MDTNEQRAANLNPNVKIIRECKRPFVCDSCNETFPAGSPLVWVRDSAGAREFCPKCRRPDPSSAREEWRDRPRAVSAPTASGGREAPSASRAAAYFDCPHCGERVATFIYPKQATPRPGSGG